LFSIYFNLDIIELYLESDLYVGVKRAILVPKLSVDSILLPNHELVVYYWMHV